ncbi:hypothetical protein HYU50_03600 [Candidatus Woesearchaeota archaeon]|nr:hypothetical protein [Candidatus Woesearchaeota archaeon]
MVKNSVIWISGAILSLLMGTIGVVGYQKCIDNVGCLLYTFIPLFPGIILNLTGLNSIIVSLIFWFLFGSLIGFLVYKVKKK